MGNFVALGRQDRQRSLWFRTRSSSRLWSGALSTAGRLGVLRNARRLSQGPVDRQDRQGALQSSKTPSGIIGKRDEPIEHRGKPVCRGDVPGRRRAGAGHRASRGRAHESDRWIGLRVGGYAGFSATIPPSAASSTVVRGALRPLRTCDRSTGCRPRPRGPRPAFPVEGPARSRGRKRKAREKILQ